MGLTVAKPLKPKLHLNTSEALITSNMRQKSLVCVFIDHSVEDCRGEVYNELMNFSNRYLVKKMSLLFSTTKGLSKLFWVNSFYLVDSDLTPSLCKIICTEDLLSLRRKSARSNGASLAEN